MWSFLIGQVQEFGVDALISKLLDYGMVGILVGAILWLLVHAVTKAGPEQAKLFLEALRLEREARERQTERLERAIVELRHPLKNLDASVAQAMSYMLPEGVRRPPINPREAP